MVEQVLAAHPRPAVRIRVVAPAKYARVGQVVWEQVAQPVDAVDCDDTGLVPAAEQRT